MSFSSDTQIVTEALKEYYDESVSEKKPVIVQPSLKDIIDDLDLASYVKEGGLTQDRLSEFMETYLSSATRLHHPTYMAHQVAAPHYAGAIG